MVDLISKFLFYINGVTLLRGLEKRNCDIFIKLLDIIKERPMIK